MAHWSRPPARLVAEFDELIGSLAGAERRQMFGCPCGFVNGQLFTGLHQSTWLVRLPPEGRSELAELGGEPFAPMGRRMREYLLLPPQVMDDPAERSHWVRRALRYAQSLPPKVKKKKK